MVRTELRVGSLQSEGDYLRLFGYTVTDDLIYGVIYDPFLASLDKSIGEETWKPFRTERLLWSDPEVIEFLKDWVAGTDHPARECIAEVIFEEWKR